MSQEDAVRFIQELQSTVSSLSKEEALLALGAAKKKIDALTDPKPGKKESTKNTSNQGKKNREKSNTSSVAPLRSSPKGLSYVA